MIPQSILRRGWPRLVRGLGLVFALLSVSTRAATITWNGGSGGLWEDSTKWSPQQIPGAGDTAVIGGTEETIVLVTDNRSVATLTMGNPRATLRVEGGRFSGQVQLTIGQGFENHGVIELSNAGSANGTLVSVAAGTLTNAPSGIIRVPVGVGTGFRRIEAVLDNRGVVEVGNDLYLLSDVANRGTVHLAQGVAVTFQRGVTWTHQGGTISGSGSLILPAQSGCRLDLDSDFTPVGFVLEARDLTVNGPGRLFAPPSGELRVNEWTIHADIVVSGDVRVEGGTTVHGALSILPGKTLRVVETATSGPPRMTVAHGFENQGIIELASDRGSGNTVKLTVSSGTLTNAMGGILRCTASGGRGVLEGGLDNRGRVEATAGLNLWGSPDASGAVVVRVANSGTIEIPEGQTLRAQRTTHWKHQGGTITGSGIIEIPPRSTSRLELEQDFVPGAYSMDAQGLTVEGPGRLLGPVEGEFRIHEWTINAPMVVSGDIQMRGSVSMGGPLIVQSGRTMRLVGNAFEGGPAHLTVSHGFVNEGVIELTSEASPNNATLSVMTGTLTNALSGILRSAVGTGGNRTLEADLDNRGTVLALAGSTLGMNGTLLNAPSGILGGGGTLNVAGATLLHEGAVGPGVSPGILTISGRAPHTAASRFEAELGGFTAGTQHDQLVLANPATLDGAIRPVLIDGFVPKKDDAFTVLTYPSRTGTFASIDNPLPERIAWDVRYGPTSAQLVVLNTAPTLAAITNRSIHELTPLALTATAMDADLPAQALTFSLAEAPDGMAIDPASGVITWTPTEAQGPGTHEVVVRVTDNGTPALGNTTRFAVTVHEVNVAPLPVLPDALTGLEEAPLTFTVAATDADLPANALTYTMVSGPEGATFDPATREFRWTPTEAQGPGAFTATFRVTDENSEAVNESQLSAEWVVSLGVEEVNQPPAVVSISLRRVDEEATLASLILATDPDLPANRLAYSLDTAPAGMAIDPSSGAITWTPTEAQGPGVHDVVVRVTDNGVPELSHTAAFGITVNEVNRPPTLAEIPSATVHAGAVFGVTLSAADPDLPANTLTYSLVTGPAGAVVSAGGRLEWSPALAAEGTVAEFTVRVSDGGEPELTSDRTFQVTVVGPVEILGTTREGDAWTLRWRAIEGNTYRLVRAPALPAAEWTPVPGEVVATSDTAAKSVAFEAGGAGGFYRVEWVR